MVAGRPYASEEDLLNKAEAYWQTISKEDWLEACEGHPKIGDVSSLKKKYAHTKQWAGNEQGGMDSASEDVIERLAQGNTDYENKFGYIFIVCASGKTATEMLELLENRLDNSPEKELKIAMGEQSKITQLRLKKLLSE